MALHLYTSNKLEVSLQLWVGDKEEDLRNKTAKAGLILKDRSGIAPGSTIVDCVIFDPKKGKLKAIWEKEVSILITPGTYFLEVTVFPDTVSYLPVEVVLERGVVA